MNGLDAVKLMAKDKKDISFSNVMLIVDLGLLFTICYILWLMLEIK